MSKSKTIHYCGPHSIQPFCIKPMSQRQRLDMKVVRYISVKLKVKEGTLHLHLRWGPLCGWLALVLIYAWPTIASSCRVAPCFFNSSRARSPFFHMILLAVGLVEEYLNLDCFTRHHLNFSKHSTHDFKTFYFRFSLSLSLFLLSFPL